MKYIFWRLIYALLILALPFGAAAIKDDALVLYLLFDENSMEVKTNVSKMDNTYCRLFHHLASDIFCFS
jgi:hypothetical protein